MATNLNLRHRATHDPDCVLDLRIDGACSPPCTVPDFSARNNHGATTNMTSVDLVIGRGNAGFALDFDGTDDHVIAAHDASLNPGTGSLTFAACFYLSYNTQNNPHVYYKTSGANIYSLQLINMSTATPTMYSYWHDNLGNTGDGYVSAAGELIKSIWTHIAIVYEAGVETRSYINGIQGTGAPSAAAVGNVVPTGALYLNSSSIPGSYNACLMEKVKIYRRVLSAGEIQALYEQGCLYAESGRMRRRKKLRA